MTTQTTTPRARLVTSLGLALCGILIAGAAPVASAHYVCTTFDTNVNACAYALNHGLGTGADANSNGVNTSPGPFIPLGTTGLIAYYNPSTGCLQVGTYADGIGVGTDPTSLPC
jgi:hypothetical protein